MEQKDTYYNYDVDKLELSLPYIDSNGNVCTVSALYDVDHNILKQNFKENENDNNPVILSYILHVTDNTYNTHDIEYKLKFKKYPPTILFTDDINDIKIYNNVDTVLNCFSTYCVKNNEIKTYKPTIYNFLNTQGEIIQPKKNLYTQIDSIFSLPEYINGKKVTYTYLLNLNYINLPFTYTINGTQQETYKTTLLLGPTNCLHNNHNTYTFKPYKSIDERFLKKINIEKINEPLNFSIIPTNYYENKLYSYTLTNGSNVCNINNLFKFKINNSYIYLSSYFSCKNYTLTGNDSTTIPGFITKFTKNYLSKKYVIYEYNDNSYITQNLQHIQTNNNKVYKYCLQYNNDIDQCVYAYSSTSYSLPKLITDNNIYYEYDNTYNTYTYYNTYIKNFQIDNAYSINGITLHNSNGLNKFNANITGYVAYTYSHIKDNILNITYQLNENSDEYLNTQLCIINYNSDNTPIYSIYIDHDDETNKEILKKLLLDCFRIYVHYDKSIVLKNIKNIFNIKYTYLISDSETPQKNYFESLNINDCNFERLYEDEFLNILATKETFNKQFSLTLYDCCIISVSLNTNKNIVSDIYIVIYNILGLTNQCNIPKNSNNIIYIEYSKLLNLLEDGNIASTVIKFNGVSDWNCKRISETHKITYIPENSENPIILSNSVYKKKLYAYFNNTLSYMCNVNIKNIWDENTIYTNGFKNLIYENFYDVKKTRNTFKYDEGTKLSKFPVELSGTSFTYNGEKYINNYTYFKWNNKNIFLSIKSTYGYNNENFPDVILQDVILPGEINKNFYVEEYTFNYSYIDSNKVTYNYTYTCLYKCNGRNMRYDISEYFGDNIVINPVLYERSSNLTKDKFYKKYIIDDDNTSLSTINTFNYKERIQEQFYRVYLNKLKYNDSIEYILPTDNDILKELYKTNKIIEFKQIIDNHNYDDPGEIISEFNEDFIKLTLSGLSINLNRIYNITTINNVDYFDNTKMLFKLNNTDKYEIKLDKNCKLDTVILLYKYTEIKKINDTEITYKIYFYYINNKFYVVVENLSNIKYILVRCVEDVDLSKGFNNIEKTDNIITGLYEMKPIPIHYNPPRPPSPTIIRYFINNPIPSINDNVICLDTRDGNINENWGKITDIIYKQTNNIDIIPLLYNEYDNGLLDNDKQLLIDTIEFLETNSDNKWSGGPITE